MTETYKIIEGISPPIMEKELFCEKIASGEKFSRNI